MKHVFQRGLAYASLALILALTAGSLTSPAAQVPPSSIKVQGYLSDRTVVPAVPATGTYNMIFRLFDGSGMGATQLASHVANVDVVDGLYESVLPFGPSLFTAGQRWLEIEVDGEILNPRLVIESTPYAFLSSQALSADSVAPDGVNTDAIQDLAVTLEKLALVCSPGDVLIRTATGWDCQLILDCSPGSVQTCYSGPGGTEGVGACMSGTATCQPDGTLGPCMNEVVPTAETCNGIDDDCNGATDNNPIDGTQYYADLDSDSYGDGGNSVFACTQPGGFVTNALDCFDNNANARPGQSAFFTTQRGDGSYDYDCDGSQQRQFPNTYSCSTGCSSFSEGWVNSVPPCGATTTFGEGCSSFPTCDPDDELPRTQACR